MPRTAHALEEIERAAKRRLGSEAARHVVEFVKEVWDWEALDDPIVEFLRPRQALIHATAFDEVARKDVELANDWMLVLKAYSAGDDVVVVAVALDPYARRDKVFAVYIGA